MNAVPSSAAVVPDPETLARMPRRTALLALLLLPAIAATIYLVVTQTRTLRVAEVAREAIPSVLMEPERVWTAVDMKLSDREMDILETHDYVFRSYSDGRGLPVDLCIVFSEDNRKGTHPPDVCLEGGGSRIEAAFDRRIRMPDGLDLEVREIVAGYGSRYTYFCYFYKCGESFTANFYEQQVKIIWYGLVGRNSAGSLIRFSTPMSGPNDLEPARQRSDELLRATFPYIRTRLTGH